jgi:hypothetical protein
VQQCLHWKSVGYSARTQVFTELTTHLPTATQPIVPYVINKWPGNVSVHLNEGDASELPWGIAVRHDGQRDRQVILWTIDTVSFLRFTNSEETLAISLAETALFNLFNFTFPAFQGSERTQYIEAMLDRASRDAMSLESWPVVGWTVDGRRVVVRLYTFAGAWACVNVDASLVACGEGLDPSGLEVVRVPNNPVLRAPHSEVRAELLVKSPEPARPHENRQPQPDHYELMAESIIDK